MSAFRAFPTSMTVTWLSSITETFRTWRYVMHETYESPKDATSSFAVAEKDPETRPGLRSFEIGDDYTGMVGNVTVPIDNRMTSEKLVLGVYRDRGQAILVSLPELQRALSRGRSRTRTRNG